MKNFQKYQKIPLLVSLLFLIASVGLFSFLYIDMKKNKNMAEESEVAWQTEAERRSRLHLTNRSLKALGTERILFDAHFIEGGDVVPFLNMVEGLAPKAGAQVQVSLVDLLKDQSGLVVEMRTSGSFEAVYKFLRLLETSPYELDFLSIDMMKTDTSDGAGRTSSAWLGVFRVKVLSFVP